MAVDLCEQNGVKGYPTIFMYEAGKQIEEYYGNRDLDDLKTFIKRHVTDTPRLLKPSTVVRPPAVAGPKRKTRLNVDGEVLELSDNIFSSTLEQGPAFVKFFAPWCGHCKKLAPLWKKLARHMQNKVTIAEVNCDEHSALCKSQDIKGYPTLVFFSNGARSEYNGGRKLDQLKEFAEKAAEEYASSSPFQFLILTIIQVSCSHLKNLQISRPMSLKKRWSTSSSTQNSIPEFLYVGIISFHA